MARDYRQEWLASPGMFGRLEPLRPAGKVQKRIVWVMRCACGDERTYFMDNVAAGKTTSCGCFRREVSRESVKRVAGMNKLPEGDSLRNKLYRDYERRAGLTGRAFELDFAYFCELIASPCYICKRVGVGEMRGLRHNGTLRYNGIDRLDNDGGYVYGNVAACCKDCNFAKRKRSLIEFDAWLSAIRR